MNTIYTEEKIQELLQKALDEIAKIQADSFFEYNGPAISVVITPSLEIDTTATIGPIGVPIGDGPHTETIWTLPEGGQPVNPFEWFNPVPDPNGEFCAIIEKGDELINHGEDPERLGLDLGEFTSDVEFPVGDSSILSEYPGETLEEQFGSFIKEHPIDGEHEYVRFNFDTSPEAVADLLDCYDGDFQKELENEIRDYVLSLQGV